MDEGKLSKKAQPRYRGWVLTINESAIKNGLSYETMVSYIEERALRTEYYCWDEEIGDTGNKHLHLYIEFSDGKTFTAVQRYFPGAHIENRKGTPTEARDYVAKPEGKTFHASQEEKSHTVVKPLQEHGDFTRLGKIIVRGQSTSAQETLNEKFDMYLERFSSIEEVQDVDLWFSKQFRAELSQRFLEEREKDLFARIGETFCGSSGQTVNILRRKVYYVFGDSRVGKTFGINLKYGSKNVYTPTSYSHPWDDYQGQRVINLDEFRSSILFSELLVIFQGYRETNRLPARYNNGVNLSDTIIISTNLPIRQQYTDIRGDHPESWQAFYNRFTAGIWEVVYSPVDDMRFFCCVSDPASYSPAARKSLDFSEPPIDINEGATWIHDTSDFAIVKQLIKDGQAVNDGSIRAVQAARAAMKAAMAADPTLPF